MKKIYILLLMALFSSCALSQSTPPPVGAFTYISGAWNPAATTATQYSLSFTPPPAALYCFNTSTNKWVPADSSCFGGGGGMVYPGAGVAVSTGSAWAASIAANAFAYLANANTFTAAQTISTTNGSSTQNLLTIGNTGTNPTSLSLYDLPQFNATAITTSNQYGGNVAISFVPSFDSNGPLSIFPYLGIQYSAGFSGTATVGAMFGSSGSGNLTIGGTASLTSAVSITTQTGSTIAITPAPNSSQTTVSCSTSGSVTFTEPLQGTSEKKVIGYLNACVGTASYTFPTAFTNTPGVFPQQQGTPLAASIVSSLSTTATTFTGATTTGIIILDGI